MPAVKDIVTLDIDGRKHLVEDLSQELQTLVYHYNRINKKDAELTDEIVMVRTAKDSILKQIQQQYQNDQAKAAQKAAEEAAKAKAAEAPAATPEAPKVNGAGPVVVEGEAVEAVLESAPAPAAKPARKARTPKS